MLLKDVSAKKEIFMQLNDSELTNVVGGVKATNDKNVKVRKINQSNIYANNTFGAGSVECPVCHTMNAADNYRCDTCGKNLIEG